MVSDCNINSNNVNVNVNDNYNFNFENSILENMFTFFNNPENLYLKEYVKNFNEPGGFFICNSNEFKIIFDAIYDDKLDNLFVLYLRRCQYVFNNE